MFCQLVFEMANLIWAIDLTIIAVVRNRYKKNAGQKPSVYI